MVHSHDRPSITGSSLPRLCCAVATGRTLGVFSDWVPAPTQNPSPRIESPDHSARHIHAIVIIYRGAHNNQIVDDRGRRCHVVLPGPVAGHIPERHFTLVAKIGAGNACGTI